MYNKIYDEMKNAMKEKRQKKVLLLRGVIASIKNATVNAGKPVTDDACMAALKKSIKELDQSIESFSKAGRADDVKVLEEDKEVLQAFLPKQMSEDELRSIVEFSVKETGATSKKDMGKVMKLVMAKAGSSVDGKTVSKLVMSMLA
jgi:uncharacterized protein YqeY